MTVLMYTPTFGDGPFPAMLHAVSLSTYTDYDHEVSYHNPYNDKMSNVRAQYQRAWQLARAGDYEALLTVEHDMIIPPNAIDLLMATDAPVVYGVYMLRHGTKTLNAWQYINNTNIGMSLSIYPSELRSAWKRGWAKVSGVGWGCTLIRREVFTMLDVRDMDNDAGDMALATDCVRAGIEQIARFDVPCLHIEPNGNILDPTKNGGIVNRVLALQTFNASVDGSSKQLLKDRYYSLPNEVASELERAGYVKITNDDDSQQESGEREQPELSEREMAVDPKARGRSKRKSA